MSINPKSQDRLIDLKKRLSEKINSTEREFYAVISPLRICPLGAHVDHQDGLVTGMALEEAIILVFSPREDNNVNIESLDFPENKTNFSIDGIPEKKQKETWSTFPQGAAWALKSKYNVSKGFDGILSGSLPIGGLSSSAAVGVAYLLALEKSNNLDISRDENIELDRILENGYRKLKNGLLDQSMILLSEKDHLTFMDCKERSYKTIPTKNNNYDIMIVYSGVSKSLGGSDYNNRVNECLQATKELAELGNVELSENPVLRDIPTEVWEEYQDELSEIPAKRARHYFTEVERVRKGIELWQEGDIKNFGRLITESGNSSMNNYECGSEPLKTIHKILRDEKGVYGTRFSGAGFRGSCIALVDPGYTNQLEQKIHEEYPKNHPDLKDKYSVHFAKSGNGAYVISLED